jgi:ABC-2 type transport system ATP-binding protein
VTNAVEVSDLTVRYGDLVAVDHVSFTAAAGEITAVLGPNGAGKTSTIEVCEGYRRAASGTVSVLGLDPATQQRLLSERMGVMLQEGGVYPSARVADTVRHYCRLYDRGVDADRLVDLVGLGARATTAWRRLSGGEKQRLSLALALAARPDVAFLDEPTSGVDINGRQVIRRVLRELADRGCAVVLATHELDEADHVADRAVIFDGGRVVAAGTLAELRAGHDEIRFRSTDAVDLVDLGAALGTEVTAVGAGQYVVRTVPDAQTVARLGSWLAAHDLPLVDLRAGAQRLEDVFRRLTDRSGDEP